MKCVPAVNEVDTDIAEIAVQNLNNDSTLGRLERPDAQPVMSAKLPAETIERYRIELILQIESHVK